MSSNPEHGNDGRRRQLRQQLGEIDHALLAGGVVVRDQHDGASGERRVVRLVDRLSAARERGGR